MEFGTGFFLGAMALMVALVNFGCVERVEQDGMKAVATGEVVCRVEMQEDKTSRWVCVSNRRPNTKMVLR